MTWKKFSLSESMFHSMEELSMIHNHSMMILLAIITTVSYVMISTMKNKKINKMIMESQTIEIIWTIMPNVTLMFITSPSLNLLYSIDEINSPSIIMKTISRQWYWTYELTYFTKKEFDSYMSQNKMFNNSITIFTN